MRRGNWMVAGAILLMGCSHHEGPQADPAKSLTDVAPRILYPGADAGGGQMSPIVGDHIARSHGDAVANGEAPLDGGAPLNQMPGPMPLRNPLDARESAISRPVVVQLSVYEVTVPAGTVSSNDAFWRHADENAVDPSTHDQLWRNGLRVGLAPQADWDYFKNILTLNPAKTQRSVSASAGQQQMALPVRQNILYQLICYIDSNNELAGRSFERSENFIAISFMPSIRKNGNVRVEVCPVVRAERTELVHTVRNNEVEIQEVRPEHFYDVNLKAEIPAEQFLIIAPSPEAVSPLLLGHAFLCSDGVTNRLEKVLILSPQPFRYEAPATRPTP